jgi:hypothetical protein
VGATLHERIEVLRFVHQEAVVDHAEIVLVEHRARLTFRDKFQSAINRFMVVHKLPVRALGSEEPAFVFGNGVSQLLICECSIRCLGVIQPDDVVPMASEAFAAKFALNTAAGAIPFVGGILAAVAGAWSEREQGRINDFLKHLPDMLAAEMKEKTQTILELTSRIDMQDEEIAMRIRSSEYQSLLRKAFRDWAGTESEEKRIFVRNLLSNAAASTLASDDVVKLFLQWIKDYSELHFSIVGAIYNSAGITRAGVWEKLGREPVREDSSDADFFRLIFRDLSTGGLVRPHRETDWQGNFLAKQNPEGAATSEGRAAIHEVSVR